MSGIYNGQTAARQRRIIDQFVSLFLTSQRQNASPEAQLITATAPHHCTPLNKNKNINMARTKGPAPSKARPAAKQSAGGARKKGGKAPRFAVPSSGKTPRGQAGTLAYPMVKKTYRFRPGTVAIREIRRYQKTGDLLGAKAPFARFVRKVTMSNDVSKNWEEGEGGLKNIQSQIRFRSTGMLALQEASEAMHTGLFEDSNLCAIHAGRVGIKPKDMKLVEKIMNNRGM